MKLVVYGKVLISHSQSANPASKPGYTETFIRVEEEENALNKEQRDRGMALEKEGTGMKTETWRKREDRKRKKGGSSKCWYNMTNGGKNILIVICAFNKYLLNIYCMSGIVWVQR